ncbi:MAG: hypothetical protein WCL19_00720 [Verrucomicrobiota bacterium]
MSYDINNYVFKGVPLSEFVANLSKHPAGTLVHFTSEDNTKNFLRVDDALVASLHETQKSLNYEINGRPIEVSKIAAAVAQEQSSFSFEGPKVLLLLTILRACGIAVSDLLAVKEESDPNLQADIKGPFNLFGVKGLPLVEMHGETLPMGLIEIPYELQGLVCVASKKENWNLLRDPRTDPESHETLEPALTLDLEKNIEWALNSPTSNEWDTWREDYCAMLINWFIKPGEQYVEEDDCWTSDVGVQSTRYGTVHQFGGMGDGEMYLIVSGTEMSGYDEDGWSDPEKETPTAYRKLKELLFGDLDYPTEKYTPQFGG